MTFDDVLAVHVNRILGAATPVPDRENEAGEFVALLAMLTLPVTAPAVAGENVTFSTTFWPADRVVPPLTPVTLNPVPVTLTLEIVTLAFPLFVSVTVCEPVV